VLIDGGDFRGRLISREVALIEEDYTDVGALCAASDGADLWFGSVVGAGGIALKRSDELKKRSLICGLLAKSGDLVRQ